MKEYICKEDIRNKLYDEDAITMRGVDIINDFPAADVREVVRSKWFDGRCTACGFKPALDYEYATVYDNYNGYRWNFCPNCGAQMNMRGE